MRISSRLSILLTLSAGFILVLGATWLASARSVSAQCARPSSCQTCHETQAQLPVKAKGSWHSDHALYDFCADCHGGGKLTADAAIAHAGISMDLNAMQQGCSTCHTENYTNLLGGYAVQIGTVIDPTHKPSSSPGAPADPLSSFLGSQPVVVDAAGADIPIPALPTESKTGNLILSGLILVVGSGGGGYIYWNEKRKRHVAAPYTGEEAILPAQEKDMLQSVLDKLGPDGRDALEILLEDPTLGEELLVQAAMLEPAEIRRWIARMRKEGGKE